MRSSAIAFLVIATALFVSPAAAQQFDAIIDGLQEVPPNASPATGYGCFTLNPDNTLDYLVTYQGLLGVETAAHIHGPGGVGVNAAAIFPFAVGTPKVGTFGPLTPAQVADLNNGLYYVNIHSTVVPGGEIRGQIFVAQNPCVVATEETTWGTVKSLYR